MRSWGGEGGNLPLTCPTPSSNLIRGRKFLKKFFLFFTGAPVILDANDLEVTVASARLLLEDEASHDARQLHPAHSLLFNHQSSSTAASDLQSLKKKFPFLSQYSDDFIKSAGPLMLIKAEAAARKLQELDRGRKAEDKLMANRESLASTSYDVEAGIDNRLDKLHAARFLPGAACSQTKMWCKAREYMGTVGHTPLSSYDMASIGLGGCVSAKGWVEIHDPASSSISIKMFLLGNTEKKSKSHDTEFQEMEDLREFKNALRTLRAAMACVHPWNRSIDALESFLYQSDFCSKELASMDKQVALLTKFVDYPLSENACRWRDMEPFLTTRDLRGTWADFFSQRSSSMTKKPQQTAPSRSQPSQRTFSSYHSNSHHQPQPPATSQPSSTQPGPSQPSNRYNAAPHLFLDDVCYLWNIGRCSKPANACSTKRGRSLRHVCNFRPDPANPMLSCGKDHPCYTNHK